MRPIQYASNALFIESGPSQTPARGWWLPRAVNAAVSTLIVALGAFTVFWMVAKVSAILWLGPR